MESEAKPQEDKEVIYREALTAGGCTRNSHVLLTLGAGKFEGVECPKCGLTVYKP